LLGGALQEGLRRRSWTCLAPTRGELDLASLERIEASIGRLSPRAVINAAAYTDVTRAELRESRKEVFLLNRDAPGAVARACRALSVPLVHLSTDYVFDGTKERPYVESDPVNPVQVYGWSKLEGERSVQAAHPDSLVVRTSTLYGPTRRARPTYVDAIVEQARRLPFLDVVELPISSPTLAPDLAEIVLDLVEAGAAGIVHAVNDGECSRLELARAIVEEIGRRESVEVRTCPASAAGMRRPRYSVLDTSRLEGILGRRPRPWREALHDYLLTHAAGGSS
jgi:dTDP-4-dehydrorhamnose reductase